jgi:hypothetical protein
VINENAGRRIEKQMAAKPKPEPKPQPIFPSPMKPGTRGTGAAAGK